MSFDDWSEPRVRQPMSIYENGRRASLSVEIKNMLGGLSIDELEQVKAVVVHIYHERITRLF